MLVTTSKRESSFPLAATTALKCVVCKRAFDFTTGEAAIVLRHVAYYYDLVHDGECLERALDWIFVEPGYDCAAFGRDQERLRIVRAGNRWALVEHADGWCRLEVIARQDEWEDEPGGLEFPEQRARLATGRGKLARQHVLSV
jgi:hypothetical protein